MTVFSCAPDWTSMLTCIYVAWASKLGHENIRLEIEPIEQYSLFDQYIHVDGDEDKAAKVITSVNTRISPAVYHALAYSSMAYEPDVLDNIYRVMILGFAYGSDVLTMLHYKDVVRNLEIRTRVGKEANRFQEFIRFHRVGSETPVYVAHIEPKSRIIQALANPFIDRMPSEHWIIVDDVHHEAVVHPSNQPYYFQQLTDDEFKRLLLTEEENDIYTDLWKTFFSSIAIKERENPRCQRNLFPIWTRKHCVEFT